MTFGKPAISTPNQLDLRSLQSAVSNARQRVEILEAAVTLLQNAPANATNIAALQLQLNRLTLATGTVTSVAATVPDYMSVAGSPVTGAGTLALTFVDQPQGLVFAGPLSGADAPPDFRTLEWYYDLPLFSSVSYTSGLSGDEIVMVERYGYFYWTTTRDIAALGGGGYVVGTAPESPDTIPATEDAANDEFQYGSSVDTSGARRPGATAWSWVNQGAATAAVSQGSVVLTAPASATRNDRLIIQTVSGSAWRYRAKLSGLDSGTPTDFYYVGLVARNSGTGRFVGIEKVQSTTLRLEYDRHTNPTTFSAAITAPVDIFGGSTRYRSAHQVMYFELELSAGSLIARYSDTGVDGTFITFGTDTVASFLGSIDGIGLMSSSLNSQATWSAWDWFRKMA